MEFSSLPEFGAYFFFSMAQNLGLPWWLSGKKTFLPMQKTGVQLQGQEDPLEKETATHSSILAWEIPWTEESGRPPYLGVAKESYMT